MRFAAVVMIVMGAALPALAQAPGEGTFAQRADCVIGGQTIRWSYHVAAEAGGELYVFAGLRDIGGVSTFAHSMARYSPLTDSWSWRAGIAPPTGVAWWGWASPAAATFGGQIYQFGGNHRRSVTGSDGPSPASWRYDPASDAWTSIPDLPTPLVNARAAATSTRIHVTGGWTATATSSTTHYELDPSGAGSWAVRAVLPNSSTAHILGVIDDRPIVAGNGLFFPAGSGATLRYSSDAWTALSPMSPPRSGAVGVVVNRRLYVHAGLVYPGTASSFRVFDPADGPTGRWTTRTGNINYAWSNHAGAVVERDGTPRIYLVNDKSLVEYTPPLPPRAPTQLAMREPGGTDLPEGAWITGGTLEISGKLVDPNTVDQIALQVECVPATEPFTGTNLVRGSLGPAPGTATVTITGLTTGAWKWQARGIDALGNAGPWQFFGDPAVPEDVNVDLQLPTVPRPQWPIDADVELPPGTPDGGDISISWLASTDNNPGAIAYELRITGPADHFIRTMETSVAVWLPISRWNYGWEVRAIDASGNVGAWSAVSLFRVTVNDGIDHGADDAGKCGFSARGDAGLLGLACLVVIAYLGTFQRRIVASSDPEARSSLSRKTSA